MTKDLFVNIPVIYDDSKDFCIETRKFNMVSKVICFQSFSNNLYSLHVISEPAHPIHLMLSKLIQVYIHIICVLLSIIEDI